MGMEVELGGIGAGFEGADQALIGVAEPMHEGSDQDGDPGRELIEVFLEIFPADEEEGGGAEGAGGGAPRLVINQSHFPEHPARPNPVQFYVPNPLRSVQTAVNFHQSILDDIDTIGSAVFREDLIPFVKFQNLLIGHANDLAEEMPLGPTKND